MLSAQRKREMLLELRSYLGTFSHADFAAAVGISPQNAYTWYQRGSFNAEQIAEKFPEISGDWLLRGEGEMLIKKRSDNSVTDVQKVLNAIREEERLASNIQEQLGKAIDVLSDLSKSFLSRKID